MATELQGVPYQAYIKDCIFRRAVEDLDKTNRVLKMTGSAIFSKSESIEPSAVVKETFVAENQQLNKPRKKRG